MKLFYLMDMKKSAQLFILLFSNFLFSQYDAIDKTMDAIPSQNENTTESIANYISRNFITQDDKIRAAFYWTASNISYDSKAINLIKTYTKEEKINSALKTRKGVCMHYSEVFNDIVNKMGMKSYVIDGYTKQSGEIARLSHAWTACMIDEKWYLVDVTWGSGYIKDNVYYKKLNNIYYKSSATAFLKTHMPFDYIWQLNENPITHDGFYNDETKSNEIDNSCDFSAKIEAFLKLSEPEKILQKMQRMEKAGLKNNFVKEAYSVLKKNFDGYKNNNSIPKLELIVSEFNDANKLLDNFIHYRNARFTPMLSDDKIKEKAQIAYDKWSFCQEELAKIVDVSKENLTNFNSLKKAVTFAQKRFDTQLSFVNEYLLKSPAERASVFVIKR